jgi:Zn-finger nucleic acid-binding protein
MLCPKCNNDMETLVYEGVEVDRCKNCNGIWFDVGESHSLRHSNAAAAIDTGDPVKGKQTNEIDRYRCPRCGGGMIRMVDPQRPQIKYEECTACRGSFFDAGEFTDVAEDVISDFIHRVSAPNGH